MDGHEHMAQRKTYAVHGHSAASWRMIVDARIARALYRRKMMNEAVVGNKNPPTEEYREARRTGHRETVANVNAALRKQYKEKKDATSNQ